MLPEFLNVDLDLVSDESLDLIVRELGDNVHVLYSGPGEGTANLLGLEVYEGDDHDADSIINAFCKLIEKLSAKGKASWKKCSSRRFDIGIESSTAETKKFGALRLDLQPKTLKRVVALDAQIAITVYPKPPAAKKKKKK